MSSPMVTLSPNFLVRISIYHPCYDRINGVCFSLKFHPKVAAMKVLLISPFTERLIETALN
jgi:hypothetical protein